MNYTVSAPKLEELNKIVGQKGGTIPTEVSNALAALQPAIVKGDKAAAQKAFDEAVAANIKNGEAWSSVQAWHDDVKKSGASTGGVSPPATGESTPPPTDTGPNFPPNATIVHATPGASGGLDCGSIPINMPHGVSLPRGAWAYFKADRDGDVASMSADGCQVGLTVTQEPSKPGITGSNATEVRPYKAGQFVNIGVGEGGYAEVRAALFSIMKYA